MQDVRSRSLVTIAVLGVGFAASGCGTGADRDRVTAVTTSFYDALGDRRGADACERLSPALRTKLVQDEPGDRCAGAVLSLEDREPRIGAVEVFATSARVRLADGASVFLGRMRQGWRIQALGCAPRPTGPYECEGEA